MLKGFPGLCGPLTERNLNDFQVDTLFAGCDGADSETGFYMSDLNVSSLHQAMIRVAKKVVIVTESAKFGLRAFVRYATPAEINTLVTDDNLCEADCQKLRDQGVNVIIATKDC